MGVKWHAQVCMLRPKVTWRRTSAADDYTLNPPENTDRNQRVYGDWASPPGRKAHWSLNVSGEGPLTPPLAEQSKCKYRYELTKQFYKLLKIIYVVSDEPQDPDPKSTTSGAALTDPMTTAATSHMHSGAPCYGLALLITNLLR